MAFSGSGSRTKVALLLSLVRASVAEFVLRTLAQDEEQAPGGARSEAVPLLHP